MAQDDLLILKLLKIPVLIIRYLSSTLAILTYLPNYLLILGLDSIIFSNKLTISAAGYLLSWPVRLVALVTVFYLFYFEFYSLYLLLEISGLAVGWQILLMIVSSQIILALMRHGYLSMIKKFDPVKLKSPWEHILEVFNFLIDILSGILALLNLLLVINAKETFNFAYQPPSIASRIAIKRPNMKSQQNQAVPSYPFIVHVGRCLRNSVLKYIRLFYVHIFFRMFPWRYLHDLESVNKERDNIPNLLVLLTLLFLGTLIDLLVFAVFGLYCYYLHPRHRVYRQNLRKEHKKYRPTLSFVCNSLIEITELIVLVFCLPFKWSQAKKVISMVTSSSNDYSRHYWEEVGYVFKLTLVKIPSLFCLLFLLLSVYKYRRLNILLEQAKGRELIEMQKQGEQSKASTESHKGIHRKFKKSEIKMEKEYLIFKCFEELFKEMFVWPLVITATIAKPWNIFWLRYCVSNDLRLECELVLAYTLKNLGDYLQTIPALVLALLKMAYDPVGLWMNVKKVFLDRRQVREQLPNAKYDQSQIQRFQFFCYATSVTRALISKSYDEILKDFFFVPFAIVTRLSLVSFLGNQRPSDSVRLLEDLMTRFYMWRVFRSKRYHFYIDLLHKDEAAGMVNTPRDRLKFWKFAHKSIRHEILSKVLSRLIPKRRAEKAIVNARVVTGYSAISNQYWHRYNITWALLAAILYFAIQLVVTLVGVIVLLPLTLWRLPTTIILLKAHKYAKRMFFPILGECYAQMARDIYQTPVKILCLILFPRSTATFLWAVSFRCHSEGVPRFKKTQQLKFSYLCEGILFKNVYFYLGLAKVVFIKALWVRRRSFNLNCMENQIRLRDAIREFICEKQVHPTFSQLINFDYVPVSKREPTMTSKIIQEHFDDTLEDIPYLLLSVFLVLTLPWRFHYIKRALLLLRDHKRNRIEFQNLLGKLSNDYLCILLYIILLLSFVKTRRTLTLIYRNFKINFYVGYLRYSHLKQLKIELHEAIHLYQSLFILLMAFAYGPYRSKQIVMQCVGYYKNYRQVTKERKKLLAIHENTVREGKQLKLLTEIGYQSLLTICQFLDAKDLTHMTRVSKYLYEGIKDVDQVWQDKWQRCYAATFPDRVIYRNRTQIAYNQMCVEAYRKIYRKPDSEMGIYELAKVQLEKSAFRSVLDLKDVMQKQLPEPIFRKGFQQVLVYDQVDGYGPEDTWPQPGDNEEFLTLMNIQRRGVRPELSEIEFLQNWLLCQPVEFVIVRLIRFYNRDSWRRTRQACYLLTTFILFPLSWILFIYNCWGAFWDITPFIGLKVFFVMYAMFETFILGYRYKRERHNWVSLHPFDLFDDFKIMARSGQDWAYVQISRIVRTVESAGRFVKAQIIRLMRPVKWVGRKTVYVYNLFVEKVAYPLYQSIARKILAVWGLIKLLWQSVMAGVKAVYNFIAKLVSQSFSMLVFIARNVSQAYSKVLENALVFALSFGMVGELVFTVVALAAMVSPSLLCYCYFRERWFVIMSTLLTMALMATGYKHLSRIKNSRSR